MSEGTGGGAPERRPLKSRGVGVFVRMANGLAAAGVHPNTVSVVGTAFALVGAAAILATRETTGAAERTLWFAGAACVQLRLLGNMLDGMVALAANKQGKMGELYNELPDRVADAALLAAAGYTAGAAPWLGWLAAVLALHVAYLRAIGAAAGAGQVFVGFMSKPQRMFTLTVVCLFQAFAPDGLRGARFAVGEGLELGVTGAALALISLGCLVTLVARWRAIRARLEDRS